MKKFNPIFMWYVAAVVFYVITLYKLIAKHSFDTLAFNFGNIMLCFGCTESRNAKKEAQKLRKKKLINYSLSGSSMI